MFPSAVGRNAHQFPASTSAPQQYASIAENIKQHERSWHACHQALFSLEVHRRQIAVQTGFRGGEEDLLPVRGPGQALNAIPISGKSFSIARKVHDGDRAAVVPL